MNYSKFTVIEGKPYLWKTILTLRKEQLAALTVARGRQLVLFDDLPEDCRPTAAKTASDRYQQPTLFQL